MRAEVKAFTESYKQNPSPPTTTIRDYMEGKSHEAWRNPPKYGILGNMRKRTKWTMEMDKILKEKYPNYTAKDISKTLEISVDAVYNRACFLGLKKDKEFVREVARKNFQDNENAKKTMFKKGLVPYNKGKKQSEYMSADAIERTKTTLFKKGHIPPNTKYDGAERINKDGYIEIRIRQGKYVLKHRKIWEEYHGEIPKGHIIIFKDNNPKNCVIENLEMISRAENAIRNNNLPNYPRDLQRLDYARTLLKQKIKQNGKK